MVKIKTAAWEPAETTAPIVAELVSPVHGRNTENSRKVQTFLYGYDLSEGFLAFYGNFYRVDIEDFINLRDLKIFRHNKSCSQAYCALHAVPAC